MAKPRATIKTIVRAKPNQRFTKLLKLHNMKYPELALLSGASLSQISFIARYGHAPKRSERRESIAHALGVSPAWLWPDLYPPSNGDAIVAEATEELC